MLWASSTNADDSSNLEYAMPVETFEKLLSDQEREEILHALHS